MMAEDESFKVTDRRGRPKEEVDADAVRAGNTGPSLAGPAPIEADTRSVPPRGPEPRGPDLQNLFLMFASSALISLGEAADPSTGERRVDLDHARDSIDMLVLLRDKTSGNRTDQESRLLEQIMYDLQMRFVRAAEAGRPG